MLLVKMVILDHLDLKENVANMHHLASQALQVDQEHLVKMVNQEGQEYVAEKDKKAKLLDWKNLKIKLLMASNLFVHNYKIVVIEIVTEDMVMMIIVINAILGVVSHVHHMERYNSKVFN